MTEHPLAETELRLARVAEHLEEIKLASQDFYKRYSGRLRWDEEQRALIPRMSVPAEPPPTVAIVASEAIFHLRVSLDYLVYQLAATNSRRTIGGTQFPIEDKPEMFDARVTGRTLNGKRVARYLKGVHPEHVDLIRQRQPFAGCAWTVLLRDLSNPDRHRKLVETRAASEPEAWSLVAGSGDAQRVLATEGYVHAILVFPHNGEQVFRTLDILRREVAATIDLFKPLIAS